LVHPKLTERRIVGTQGELEREWGSLADGILGLAGGFLTLDAAFESWSWASPAKETPLGLIDESSYYTGLLKLASDEAVDRFVRESQRGLLAIDNRAEEVLRRLADYRPPETRRHEPREFDE
jgi:predicted Rossmann-fold nucleotide-binding protein